MIFWTVFGAYGLLLSPVALIDARKRIIPNRFVAAGGVLALGSMMAGWIPWTHLIWAAATWALYEWRMARWPGTLGWGDVKWAAVTMAIFGGAGGLIVGMGHLGVYAWGTWRWWHGGRKNSTWKGQAAPWAPGAWVGWILLGTIWSLLR